MRCTLFFLWISLGMYGQTGILPGVVASKVQLDAVTGETYSVYLPSNYDELKEYPTVFIFNIADDTAKIVQQFTIGAELTESIIIGANFKVSDTIAVGLKQGEKLINNALNQFSVDPSKIILAGLDNGALIASTSAHLSKDVYGVIAVGNVFFEKKMLQKNSGAKFTILSPNEGAYYYKLSLYDGASSLRDIVKGHYIYDGKGWPEPGYLSAALTDLLLTDTTEEVVVKRYYDSDLRFARQLYERKLHLEAFDFTNNLKAKYNKRLDLDSQKALSKEIRADRAYRFKKTRQATVRNAEVELIQDFNYYLKEDTQNAFFDNLGWWSYQMDELDVKIDSTASSKEERKAALRLRGYLVKTVEEKYDLFKIGNASTEQLLFVNVLRTLVDPFNQDAYLEAIALSAREGDPNASLFYLEELMKTGYDDYERLYAIDHTIALRISYEFNEIIKAYLGKSKYFDE